jgi:hypothetical protein
VAAAKAFGRSEAVVEIVRADRAPDSATLDSIDLDAWEQRIRRIWQAAHASEPRIVAGDACWRCACLSRCPAHLSLALALADGSAFKELPTLELTVPAVARGWEMLKKAKALLGEIERTYRAFAAGEPVPLANGKTLSEVEKKRESLSGRIAFEVLRERCGQDVAQAACEVETSKAAIQRAIKDVALKGTAAGVLRDVLDEIGKRNGIVQKITHGVEER